ncbi:unnamed protein product, partial [Mesorhabditis belari]|uniref:Replication protein A C-terminal domain-containing protein n=1 Tax=Mesorhabditis belari TaxID=2138241 RepID=A0AAF3EZL8_9BILA
MANWGNESFGDGGGWGGDGSFLNPNPSNLDSSQQRLADKMPFPVTVEKIATTPCADDKLSIGKIGFSQIVLYGCVDSVQEVEAGSMFRMVLSDPDNSQHTVPVTILRMFDSGDEDNVTYAEGTLIALIGKLRNSGGEMSVLVLKSREVTNRREYECFKCESQLAQMYFEKGIGDAIRNNQDIKALMNSPLAPGNSRPPTIKNPVKIPPLRSSLPQQKPMNAGMSARDKVIQYLKQESKISGENGVHIDRISQETGVPVAELQKHLDNLTGEGEAFQTIDSEHYAVF